MLCPAELAGIVRTSQLASRRPTSAPGEGAMHRPRLPRSRSAVGIAGVLAVLVCALPARGNIGPQWWGGYASEPQGGLKDVAITRETLTIDLRPVAETQPALVEAT